MLGHLMLSSSSLCLRPPAQPSAAQSSDYEENHAFRKLSAGTEGDSKREKLVSWVPSVHLGL